MKCFRPLPPSQSVQTGFFPTGNFPALFFEPQFFPHWDLLLSRSFPPQFFCFFILIDYWWTVFVTSHIKIWGNINYQSRSKIKITGLNRPGWKNGRWKDLERKRPLGNRPGAGSRPAPAPMKLGTFNHKPADAIYAKCSIKHLAYLSFFIIYQRVNNTKLKMALSQLRICRTPPPTQN